MFLNNFTRRAKNEKILGLLIFLICITLPAYAQILNGGFEIWDNEGGYRNTICALDDQQSSEKT